MKWFVILLIAILVTIGSMLPISGYFARRGLAKPTSSWAPTAVQVAGRVRMFAGRYQAAADLWQLGYTTWPTHPDAPKMYFRRAFCLEKMKRPAEARVAYEAYLARYPKHVWSDQARRRIGNLDVSD